MCPHSNLMISSVYRNTVLWELLIDSTSLFKVKVMRKKRLLRQLPILALADMFLRDGAIVSIFPKKTWAFFQFGIFKLWYTYVSWNDAP